MKESKINQLASKHLGSAGSYAIETDRFDKSFLVPMPRSDARKDWDITGDEFVGVDVWNCHEATFLLNNGVPIAGTLKFLYSSDSEFMVESKSMKLYLNTFDMCRLGDTVEIAIATYENLIKSHLEDILSTKIKVGFHQEGSVAESVVDEYIAIEKVISIEDIVVEDYKAEKSHFKTIPGDLSQQKVFTNVLRSRCRHTKQKDTGAAYIEIRSKEGFTADLTSLFKLIVSLREVDEFHEFCAEKLYIEVMKDINVESCSVVLLYARRGSLDINPVRASNINMIPKVMLDTKYRNIKIQCQ